MSTCASCSRFHRAHGRIATVTAVRPPARFGGLVFDGDLVTRVHREAADRRRVDQRRLPRLRARALRLPRRRRDEPRGGRAGAPRRGRAARRVPSPALLAVHGHAARQAPARVALGDGRGTLGGDVSAAFWPDRPTFVTGATGLVGGWPLRRLVEAGRRRRLPRARLGAAVRAVRGGLLERARSSRGDVRDQSCWSARSASTRSTPSCTSRPRRSWGSPTATRSRPSRPTSRAPGRCSRPAAAARRVKQIVLASSDKAYGEQAKLPYREDDAARGQASLRRQQVVRRPDRAPLRRHLRAAGDDHALRQLLRRRRSELEPHRPRHDPLGAARPAAGDPLRRHARARLLLRRGRRGGIHAARGVAGGESRRAAARPSTSRTRRSSRSRARRADPRR